MILASLAVAAAIAAQSPSLRGIEFTVDSSADLGPQGLGAVKPPAMRVTYAAGRGRADVLSTPQRPALRIGDVIVAPFLASPGDYYLFDSTGFILVRPAARTFSSFRLIEAAFNYVGRRDGWPGFFRMAPTLVDTLRDSTAQLITRRGDFPMYWHADVARDTVCGLFGCSIEELVRGRSTLVDAPAEELSVARWFGPAQALAELPGGVARLDAKPVRVTTVSSVTGVHRLRDLRTISIDPRRLVLPPDFKETALPGFAAPRTLTESAGERWRSLPQ